MFKVENTTINTKENVAENAVVKLKHIASNSYVSTVLRTKDGQQIKQEGEEDIEEEDFGGDPDLMSDEDYEIMNSEDKDGD